MTIKLSEPLLKDEYYENFSYTPFKSKTFTKHNGDCSLCQVYGGRVHFRSSYSSSNSHITCSLSIVKYWAYDLEKEHTSWKQSSYASYPQYARSRLLGGDFPLHESFSKRKDSDYYDAVETTGDD